VFPALRSFAALFHAARVPGVPFRAFPSRGAVPALASRCFLVGSRSTIAGAVSTCASPDFHRLRRPFAKARPEARRDAWARTTDPRQARPIRRSAGAPRLQTACSSKPGSPVNRRHAHFEALLPPRVRSRGDSYPGRGCLHRVGALLGFFPSRACSTIARDTTRRERDTQAGQGPFRMKLGNPDVPRRSRHPDSDPGF